jgi:hypothetical protein
MGQFWKPFEVSSEDLKTDFTYSVKSIIYEKDGKKTLLFPKGPAYAYTFPSGRVKIYQPYETEFKWTANVTKYDIGGTTFKHYPESKDLYVCKSYKDGRINNNLGYNTRWIQGEGWEVPEEILKQWYEEYERIFIFFDNDRAGIQGALNLANKANALLNTDKFIPIWLRDQETKDNGEFIIRYGADKLRQEIDEISNSRVMAALPTGST